MDLPTPDDDSFCVNTTREMNLKENMFINQPTSDDESFWENIEHDYVLWILPTPI